MTTERNIFQRAVAKVETGALKLGIEVDKLQIKAGVVLIWLGVLMPPLIPLGLLMTGTSAVTLPIQKDALKKVENGGSNPIPNRRLLPQSS